MLEGFGDEFGAFATVEGVVAVERRVHGFDFLEFVELLAGEFR